MKQIRIFAYSLDLVLSNKYIQVTIQCLEPKVFNVKVEVLFYKIKKFEKTSTLSLNIFGSRDFMSTWKEQSPYYKKISILASYFN